MHTSRLATLFFTILSLSTASHASTSQSQDGFYKLVANHNDTLMYIQKSTPLSTIRTYFSNENYSPDILFKKFTEHDNGLVKVYHYTFNLPNKDLSPQAISFQDFLEKHLSINKKKTTQNFKNQQRPVTKYFLDVHTTPIKASSKASTIIFEYHQPDEFFKSLQVAKSNYDQCIVFANNTALKIASDKDIETLRNIVPLPQTKPAQPTNNTSLNTPNNNKKKETKTSLITPKPKKKILDNNNTNNNNISPLPNNDTPLSKTNDTSLNNNNNLNNTSLNTPNNNKKKETKTSLITPKPKKKILDNNNTNNNNISPLSNNDTPLSKTNDTSLNNNNHLNNTSLNTPNNNKKKRTKRLLPPPKSINQHTLNNNNNNASNQAGTYILVVFGLIVCTGAVYAILQKSPTSKSHKPNQDARTR